MTFRIFSGSFGYNDPVLCSATVTTGGWRCDWDSANVANGVFDLRAVAVNVVGVSYGTTVEIMVRNAPAP